MKIKMILVILFLKIATRNIFRNWRHSLATFLAMIFGFLAISLFDGFLKEINWKNIDGYTRRGMLGDVIIQKKGASEHLESDFWNYTLTEDDQKAIEQDFVQSKAVSNRVRFLSITGMMTSGEHSGIFVGYGYDVVEGAKARGDNWAWNTVAGIPLQNAKPDSLLIGTGLAKKLGCTQPESQKNFVTLQGFYEIADRPFHCENQAFILSSTTASGQVNTATVNIAGFIDGGFREYNKMATHLSLLVAQRLMDTKSISMLAVQLKEGFSVEEFIANLQKNLNTKNIFVDAVSWRDHKLAVFVKNVQKLLQVFRNLFMSVIVIVVIMSVSTTMAKSVDERIRELGTLRSFGFTKFQLQFMIAVEGFMLGLISSVVGFVLAILGALAISKLGIEYRAGILSMPVTLQIQLAPEVWVYTSVLIISLATLSSWWASKKTFKGPIALALTHV